MKEYTMDSLWDLYGAIATLFLSTVVGYGALMVFIRPNPAKSTETNLIKQALKSIGIDRPAWHTLVVTASRDVDLPADALWETWSNLEDWPAWSTLHTSARWSGEAAWQLGARFEQDLKLGFPLGRRKVVETVSELYPGRRVRWCKTDGRVKSCHIWSFSQLPNRKVRLTNTEVIHGLPLGLLKPILYWQWHKKFEKSLDGLVAQARTSRQDNIQLRDGRLLVEG
jgi:uncharacterized membrane protein